MFSSIRNPSRGDNIQICIYSIRNMKCPFNDFLLVQIFGIKELIDNSPEHVRLFPSKIKPFLHEHLNEPSVLLHWCSQPPFCTRHSSMSVKKEWRIKGFVIKRGFRYFKKQKKVFYLNLRLLFMRTISWQQWSSKNRITFGDWNCDWILSKD